MKILKKLFFALLLLAIILGIALFSLTMLVNPNRLKPIIVNEVKQETGYQLNIEGDLAWSFYPRVGVKVKRMLLTAPKEPQPFAELHDVTMAVSLYQWLRGEESLSGDLHIADLVFMNLHFAQLRATLYLQDGVLSISPIQARFYGGALEGVVHARSFEKTPRWEGELQLKGVNLGALWDDLYGSTYALKLTGTMNGHLKIDTVGRNRETLIAKASGMGEYQIDQGAVCGVDVNYFIQLADAIIHKKPQNNLINTNQTAFDALTGSFTIDNGVLATHDLLLTAKAFTAHAAGKLALLAQTLDFELQIKSQQDLLSQWEIPLNVAGTVHRPTVTLDQEGMAHILIKQDVEKAKTKVRDVIKKHVPGKAGEFLQNLIN
ncbi:MAG TPA: AsmA family protein [Gammaproteobacteria bacterium]|jgi:AsmA protein|nr:AsmA family protein [Gammaproteobacteria bacterium]